MKTKFYALSLLLIISLAFLSRQAAAQNGSVGVGTTNPDPSAILDVSSINKGVLLPRLTVDQRNAISSPATGLLIYQWDIDPGFYYYLNGWQPMGSAGALMANRTLSNLVGPTAVNTSLLPATSGAYSLGSPSSSWLDISFSGDAIQQGSRFIGSRGTNIFFGNFSGNAAVTGSFNTSTGSSALTTNITGSWNTANGYEALHNTNGAYSNTAVGYQSLIGTTNGYYNTGIGAVSLSTNATGIGNSALGVGAGSQSSGNYNTYLGHKADGPFNTSLDNSTAVGYEAIVTASNTVRVGNSSIVSIGGFASWTNFSDGRYKRNVKEDVPGLAFIAQLRPVTYNLDVDGIDKELRPMVPGSEKAFEAMGIKKELSAAEKKSKQEKTLVIYSGFIAQEVEQAAKKLGYRFSGVDAPKNSKDFYGLRYAEFTVPLVKAVQELNKKIESLEQEKGSAKNLEAIIQKQQSQLDKQQQEIEMLKKMMLELQKQNSAKPGGTGN